MNSKDDRWALSLALCIVALMGWRGVQAQTCGNCNGQGGVDITDALAAAQHSVGLIEIGLPAFVWCNVVGITGIGGIVDTLDSLAIARFSAGLPPALSCSDVPYCRIIPPGPGSPAGQVRVDWFAVDSSSRVINNAVVQWSTNDGVTWAMATPGSGGSALFQITSSPYPGSPQVFVWDSTGDAVGLLLCQVVKLRITVTTGGQSSGCESAEFGISNRMQPMGTWTQIPCELGAPCPLGRFDTSWTYDPIRQRLLLFGGAQRQLGAEAFNDVWAFDVLTDTWTQLFPTGVLPGVRSRHVAVFDAPRNRLVMFGGTNRLSPSYGISFSDIWELDFSSDAHGQWTELGSWGSTSFMYGSEVIRVGGPANDYVYIDSGGRQRIVMPRSASRPQGEGSATPLFDSVVVELDLTAGGLVWGVVAPAGGSAPPDFLRTNAIFYDPLQDRLLQTGGLAGLVFHSGLWDFRFGASSGGHWELQAPCGGHPDKLNTEIAYDTNRAIAMHFSGFWVGGPQAADTWVLDPFGEGDWKQMVTAALTPVPRSRHAFAYDPEGGRMLLFGGFQFGVGGVDVAYDDTWELRY